MLDAYNTKLPGLTSSWERILGMAKVEREYMKVTYIPTAKCDIEQKIGSTIINTIFERSKF